jgi:hypothetical protein
MNIVKTALATLLCAVSVQACAVGGMADINVYDRSESRSLPVYWHEGRAWVVGKPGNEYQISVRSRQGDEVLAVLSVDGINVITGETASPQQSGYVLSPGRALDVRGWRKNMERTAAFYFTSLPDSYAARTGRPDNVGAIGLALFRRKAQEPAPIAQPDALSKSERNDAAHAPASRASEAALGTGHGRQEVSLARYVGFERASSEPAETITLYYDSHANLVARGVIRAPLPPRRPLPNPFPGFVADPPA